jgi:hypothetical protein
VTRNYRLWTEREDWYLTRYYRMKGARLCAEKLGRTRDQVHYRARRLNLSAFVAPQKHQTVAEVALQARRGVQHVTNLAHRDGVLKRTSVYAVVPEEWAREFIRSRQEADARKSNRHLSLTKAAARLGLHVNTLRDAITRHPNTPLGHAVAHLTLERYGHGNACRYAIDAAQVERAKALLERSKPIGFVPLKVAAIELGVSDSLAHELFKRERVIDVRAGRRTSLVPRESLRAELMRRGRAA